MAKYRGITYPSLLSFKPVLWLWKRFCCPRKWHLFDEVSSYRGGDPVHYLNCDACALSVGIESIETYKSPAATEQRS